MKKNLTKKLMLSVLTLAFAVVSLGASTFAWFTVGKDANVESFNAQVVSGAGIEIAVGSIESAITVDDGNLVYKADEFISEFAIGTLPKSDVKKAVLNNKNATDDDNWPLLNNVSSSVKGLSKYTVTGETKTANLFNGTLYSKVNNAAVTAITNKEKTIDDYKADGSYYAFKLYIRTEQDGQVKLNDFALTQNGAGEKWAAGVEYTDGNNKPVAAEEKVAYSLVDAARLAFIYNDKAKKDAEPTLNAPVYQGSAGSEKGENSQGFSANGALQVYNSKYNEVEDEQIPAITDDDLPAWEKTPVSWDNQTLTLNVYAGEIYELEVYIWIEGYDAECYNAIFSQMLNAQFSFSWVETE